MGQRIGQRVGVVLYRDLRQRRALITEALEVLAGDAPDLPSK